MADQTAHRPLQPLTIDHFRRYTGLFVLDTYERWEHDPFQLEIVDEILRGARQLILVIPEGNAKTTLMSGVALYHLAHVGDAVVPMAAASREQIGILFEQAAGFVRRTRGLDQRFRIYKGYREIVCHRTSGKLKVYGADDSTADGVIFTLGLLDELHRQRDLSLWRTWEGKLNKRGGGGQMAGLSTGGDPGGEFEQLRQGLLRRAGKHRRRAAHERVEENGLVLHDYAVPPDGDVEDLEQVKAANPLSTITVETLRRKRQSPTMTLPHWTRFTCDRPARGEFTAIGELEWANAETEEDIPEGEGVYCGLDIGWKHDTTALWPIWVPNLGLRRLGWPQIITPPRDGTSLHPQVIKDAAREIHAETPIRKLVVDGAVGGEVLAAEIGDELGCDVVVYGNGHNMQCLAYDRWMEGLREGTLQHPGHEEATQHVMNARARVLADGRTRFERPVTTRSAADLQDRRVIDALSAGSIAHSTAIGDLRAEPEPPSVEPFAALI